MKMADLNCLHQTIAQLDHHWETYDSFRINMDWDNLREYVG